MANLMTHIGRDFESRSWLLYIISRLLNRKRGSK